MQTLTSEGRRVVARLARRHGFSEEAVAHMLQAVRSGNGAMAMFDHPELGGSGQWMKGGMLMLSDMLNHALKARVDALCSEISGVLADEPDLLRTGSAQVQTQSAAAQRQNAGGAGAGLFAPDAAASWWPAELGQPSATGSQNSVRYAYFDEARRLAVDVSGRVRIYDTLDHRIGGFSQQQAGSGSITFTSQHGTVDLNTLPVLSAEGHSAGESRAEEDAIAAIERLGRLRDEGLITEAEFAEKKAELLRRV